MNIFFDAVKFLLYIEVTFKILRWFLSVRKYRLMFKILESKNIRVVSEPVLIVSGWTCNAIHRNSNEVLLFCQGYQKYKVGSLRTQPATRVANITDFSQKYGIQKMISISPDFYTEFRNFRIFYGICNFLIFSTFFIIIGNHYMLRPWNSWTANTDKKYIELNGAAFNVNKPCVTSRKTARPKDKERQKMENCGNPFINVLVIQKYVYSFLNFPKNGIS